ncbi:hypothetical protein [Micromonospora sp. NPDC048898]|uniref:hypothetical protein n=1 Tax=Micromonospora sp. NPDC048898 TaxID=3364260 RepID=UPI0037187862
MSTPQIRATRDVAEMHQRIGADGHLPDRPSWTCQACEPGAYWPCAPAQNQIAEAYGSDRVGLAGYAGTLYYVAVAERPADDPGELYERIVGWVRRFITSNTSSHLASSPGDER